MKYQWLPVSGMAGLARIEHDRVVEVHALQPVPLAGYRRLRLEDHSPHQGRWLCCQGLVLCLN